MAIAHYDEFRRESVRIELTSGQPQRQATSNLSGGFSTLAKWIQGSRPSNFPPDADLDLAK